MKKKRSIVLLLGVGLFTFIACSSNESSNSNSTSKDSINNSTNILPTDKRYGSTYNSDQMHSDTLKTNQDSIQKNNK
jgi:hypothetical protein